MYAVCRHSKARTDLMSIHRQYDTLHYNAPFSAVTKKAYIYAKHMYMYNVYIQMYIYIFTFIQLSIHSFTHTFSHPSIHQSIHPSGVNLVCNRGVVVFRVNNIVFIQPNCQMTFLGQSHINSWIFHLSKNVYLHYAQIMQKMFNLSRKVIALERVF